VRGFNEACSNSEPKTGGVAVRTTVPGSACGNQKIEVSAALRLGLTRIMQPPAVAGHLRQPPDISGMSLDLGIVALIVAIAAQALPSQLGSAETVDVMIVR